MNNLIGEEFLSLHLQHMPDEFKVESLFHLLWLEQ